MNDFHQQQLILYLFWHVEKQQSEVRYFREAELAADPALVSMVGSPAGLTTALQGLLDLGLLLAARPAGSEQPLYFINGPLGRAAVQAINNGQWTEQLTDRKPVHLQAEPPNIFKLYEDHIGSITPMMADILKLDEAQYPAQWIADAIRIAVVQNARNWKYVQAILERWQKEGRGNEQNRRDNPQDPGSYRESWLGKD